MSTLKDEATRLAPHAKAVMRSAANPSPPTAAKSLGLFGAGLGLAELLAPRMLTRGLDIRGREGFVRAMGVREIASAVLIARNRRMGMWSRVGGDILDVVALAGVLPGSRRKRNVGLALGVVLGAALLDMLTARALGRSEPAPAA